MTETPSNDKNYNTFVIAGIFLLGAFMTFLNSTFMNVALPDIMKDLNISVSTAQWLSTGYMLATGIVMPFTAFLIDRFKTKTLFILSKVTSNIGIVRSLNQSFKLLSSLKRNLTVSKPKSFN